MESVKRFLSQRNNGRVGYLLIFSVIFGILFLSVFFGIAQHKEAAKRMDEYRTKAVMAGELPGALRGLGDIRIQDEKLIVGISVNLKDHSSDSFIAPRLIFSKNENPSGDINTIYTYNDAQAQKAALLYSFIEAYDDVLYTSKYQENLFLESFDGKEAKFIVILAKRDGSGKWQFYAMKKFSLTGDSSKR